MRLLRAVPTEARKQKRPRNHLWLRGPSRDGRIRTGDPLNPMDRTAEVGMSNLVKNQGLLGDLDVESRESVCGVSHPLHTPGAYSSEPHSTVSR